MILQIGCLKGVMTIEFRALSLTEAWLLLNLKCFEYVMVHHLTTALVGGHSLQGTK